MLIIYYRPISCPSSKNSEKYATISPLHSHAGLEFIGFIGPYDTVGPAEDSHPDVGRDCGTYVFSHLLLFSAENQEILLRRTGLWGAKHNRSRGRYADSELLWAIEPTISQKTHQKSLCSTRRTALMSHERCFDPASGYLCFGSLPPPLVL